MSDDPDRPNALLTAAQRRYLRGNGEYSSGHERKKRGEIRDRIRNSLLDFTLLTWRLEDRDREQVFDPLRETPDGEGYEHQGTGHRVETFEQGELLDGLHNALGFLYRATEDAGLPFEQFLRTAVERSLPPGPANDVTVDIEVEREECPDVETARAVMREDGRLTDAEFRVLVEHPGVRTADVVEHSKGEQGEEQGGASSPDEWSTEEVSEVLPDDLSRDTGDGERSDDSDEYPLSEPNWSDINGQDGPDAGAE
jgi:hypothetical protein